MNVEELLDKMQTDLVYEKLDLQNLITDLGLQNFVNELLNNVGNTSSLIRENIYSLFYRLVEEKFLNHEDCANVIITCIGDSHLYKGISNKGDDTVFFRSYSSLVIAGVVGLDKKLNFFTQDLYMLTLNKAIKYMELEVDRRGFIENKGWAHAIAHGADMLCALVEHNKFSLEFSDKILNCIKIHVISRDVYIDGDQKRLANVINCLINKNCNELKIKNWVKSLIPSIKSKIYTNEHYNNVRILNNIEYFLDSLYFVLAGNNSINELKEFIIQFVDKMWKHAHSDT